MGKRKNKRQDDPFNIEEEEEQEDECQSQCPHVVRAVHLASIKKSLKESGVKTASDHVDKQGSEVKEEARDDLGEEKGSGDNETSPETSCWLCMRSGHQGFDTKDKNQSEEYYKVPRSDLHCVFLFTNNWTVWCYECGTDITKQNNKKISEAVDFVRKQSSNNKISSKKLKSKQSPKQTYEESINKSNSSESNFQSSLQPPTKPETNKKNSKAVDNKAAGASQARGLSNLGNTCFFNSVMQCLARTPSLPGLLKLWQDGPEVTFKSSLEEEASEGDNGEIPAELSLRLAEVGPVMASFSWFVQEMTGEGKKGVLNPGALFTQISKRCPKFRGRQQEDSHELLRNLIELLRIEEAKRQMSAILKQFGLSDQSNPKSVPSQLKKKVQAFSSDANHTVIDRIFSGQIVSTIVCHECFHSSVNYEEVLDLSLPIASKNFDQKSVHRLRPKRQDNKNAKKFKGGKKKQKKGVRNNRNNDSEEESGNEDETEKQDKEKDEAEKPSNFLTALKLEDKVSTWTLRTLAPLAPKRSVAADELSVYSCLNDFSRPEILDGDNKWACDACTKRIPDTEKEDGEPEPEEKESEESEEKISPKDSESNSDSNLSDDGSVPLPAEEGPDNGGVQSAEAEGETLSKDSEESKFTECGKENTSQETEADKDHDSAVDMGSSEDSQNNEEDKNTESTEKITETEDDPKAESDSGSSDDELKDEPEKEKSSKDQKKCKTVYCVAQRQVLVYTLPPVLTLHLKRFQQTMSGLRKIDRHVSFPLTLDLTSYCSSTSLATASVDVTSGVQYSLYGIVEHSGSLFGGHYVAYIRFGKTRTQSLMDLTKVISPGVPKDTDKCLEEISVKLKSLKIDKSADLTEDTCGEDLWYYVSDSHVSLVSEERVLKSQAYLLFYERIL